MQRRIKRDFRQPNSPAKFLAFCKKVKHGLTDNPNCPETMTPLRQQYFEKMDLLETSYHLALDGGRSLIREREKLTEEIVVLLERIALSLESALVLNPDALLTTGFAVTRERRSPNRIKMPLIPPPDFTVTNLGESGRALGTASPFPGALNQEIHLNHGNPAVEADWFHKSMFPKANSMMMEHVVPGNTFARMRYHGLDGPGPWSAVVSVIIT